jgi:transposase
MPSRYDASTKARAIRLAGERRGDYPTEYAAITAVAGRLGMSPETLRLWVRQDEVDSGKAAGVTTGESKKVRDLKRKVRGRVMPLIGLSHRGSGPGQSRSQSTSHEHGAVSPVQRPSRPPRRVSSPTCSGPHSGAPMSVV